MLALVKCVHGARSCLLWQVEVFCYALSPPDGSEWRQRIEAETEHFLDVSAWGVPDIARRISADGIQASSTPCCLLLSTSSPACMHAFMHAQQHAVQCQCIHAI